MPFYSEFIYLFKNKMETLEFSSKVMDENPAALQDYASLAHHLKKLVRESLKTAAKVAEEEKENPQIKNEPKQ